MHTLVSLRSRPDLTQFIPSAPDMSGNAGNVLSKFGPSCKGEAVDSPIHWVTFHGASNDVQFSHR